MQKITKTFLRTEETMNKYIEVSEDMRVRGEKSNPFLNWKDNLVKEFKNWVIVRNNFPYDAIASVSHMISTKREVAFDWNLLTQEEKDELSTIKDTYIKDTYDVLWENLPKGQTIHGHFHLHLITLKRE